MEVIGVDLGGHNISAAVIQTDGGSRNIAARMGMPTPAGRGLGEVVSSISDVIAKLSEGRAVCSAGIGVPAFLDKKRMKITRFTNFSGLENIEFPILIKNALKNRGIDVPVRMENDANCSALGEGLCGAAKGCSDYVVLTLGTGIGAGIVANGRLLAGARGMAGEAGHIPIFNYSWLKCACGGAGHLESVCSADSVEKAALKEGLPADFKELWKHRNEEKTAAIIEPALDALARAIAAIVVILDPEKVILNGGISRAENIREELAARTIPYLSIPFRQHLDIVISALGPDAALFGAASLI